MGDTFFLIPQGLIQPNLGLSMPGQKNWWSTTNPSSFCQLPGCHEGLGTLQHILLEYPCLSNARVKSISHWTAFLVSRPWLFPIITKHTLGDPKVNFQFLLDPSVLPAVISACQINPEVLRDCLYLARTWNFSMHLARQKIRKYFNIKNWTSWSIFTLDQRIQIQYMLQFVNHDIGCFAIKIDR